MNRIARRVIVGALELSRVLPSVRQRPDVGRAVILRYHSVSDNDADTDAYRSPSIAVTPRTFERQMRMLADRYVVVPMAALVERLVAAEPFEPRTVAITFDDGYMDNFRFAMPVLARLGLPATIYVTTGAIGNGWAFWPSRLRCALMRAPKSRLVLDDQPVDLASRDTRAAAVDRLTLSAKRLPVAERDALVDRVVAAAGVEPPPQARGWFMGWEELRAVMAAGLSIGAHTLTHPILTVQAPEVAASEISGSRTALQQGLDAAIDHFAFPNGGGVINHDDRTAALVRGAGFRSASTSVAGPVRLGDEPFTLRRIGVNEACGVDGLVFNLERDRLGPALGWRSAGQGPVA